MFNRRFGLLGLAIAMLTGSAGPSMNAQNQIASGAAIMHGLRNKYRETARYPGKRSGVAAAKRAKAKRRNIAKHPNCNKAVKKWARRS